MALAELKPAREDLCFIADLAGESDRHKDVVKQIKLVIEHYGPRLFIEERNLLSIAYKIMTNSLRNSLRVANTLLKWQSERPLERKNQLALIRRQCELIERELTDVCQDIVSLLDHELIPAAEKGEEGVFYSKMKGDYCRYLAEVGRKRDRDRFADQSLNAYKEAFSHALSTLPPLHPTRLGLALNFSVFYHDVRKSPERACHLAKTAFDDAVLSVDMSNARFDQSIRDSMAILQLLMDDLLLWSGEIQGHCVLFLSTSGITSRIFR